MRALDLACAMLLLALASVKVAGAGEMGEWGALTTIAWFLEITLGLLFLFGRAQRFAATTLVCLGMAFSIHVLAKGPSGYIVGQGCGCLGRHIPTFVEHLGLSLLVLLLGSFECLWGSRRRARARVDQEA